jgi:hypothetical protein
VQLIYAEPHGEDPIVTANTRGGVVTREDIMTQGKNTEDLGIRKDVEKTQNFDANKERHIF